MKRRRRGYAMISLLVFFVGFSSVNCVELSDETSQFQRQEKLGRERAVKLCQQLPGWQSFEQDFALKEPFPMVGLINEFPNSLVVLIKSKQSRLVDSIWWWDPLDKGGRPKVDWNGLRAAYDDASEHISVHSWLNSWKHAGKGRSIELHLFGTQIGEVDWQIKDFYLPAWRDAGFKGVPAYSVLLRRADDSWTHILFGREESRSLVVSSLVNLRHEPALHWLDTFDLSFHPKGKRGEKYSKYVIISRTGEWQLKTYSKAPPGGRKKIIPVSYGGGDGTSLSKAVVIKASDEEQGVAAEYRYVAKHFNGYRLRSQSLFLQTGGPVYDVMKFIGPDGKEHTIYFDISSYFGKS
jgi:hypothetical protein